MCEYTTHYYAFQEGLYLLSFLLHSILVEAKIIAVILFNFVLLESIMAKTNNNKHSKVK